MDAVRCMERAMKMEPKNNLGWSNLASMVGRLGQHEKALECAERALALDPKMVEAHLHGGRREGARQNAKSSGRFPALAAID